MKEAVKSLGAVVALCMAAQAGEFHWTGGGVVDGVGAWTDPANWQEGSVPGIHTNSSNAVVGSVGDTAIFPASSADQVVDFGGIVSVKAIRLNGTGTGRYSFGVEGRVPEQVMRLEKNGAFVVESSVARMPLLHCGIGVGEQGGTTRLTNDVAGAELVVSNIGYTTSTGWTSAGTEFAGAGGFRLVGKLTSLSRMNTTHSHTGKFYYASDFGSCGTFSISSGCGEIVICEGFARKARMDGYGYGTLTAYPGNMLISGGGTFQFCAGKTENSNSHDKWNNAPINLGYHDVIISTAIINGYDGIPAAGKQVGIRTASTSAGPDGWNTGTLVLASPNCRLNGEIEFYSAAALKVDSFGLKGEQSRVGWCTNFYLCNNARLIYTGAGETTDRNLHFGRTCHARDAASLPSELYTPSFSVDQSGTGKFIVASTLDVAEAETVNSSFRPNLTLTGNSAADGEWSGNLTLDNLSVVKKGTGRWILSSSENDIRGTLFVNSGTLRVDHPATLGNGAGIALDGGVLEIPANATSSAVLPPVSVSANSTLRLGSGASVTFSSLAVTAGKTLAIVTDDESATVKLDSGWTAGDLPRVTMNGLSARVNDSGTIVVPGTAWINSSGGSWHEGANWTDGVPTALGAARIGIGGNFEVGISSAAVCSNLNVRNFSGATKLSVGAPLVVSPNAIVGAMGNSTVEVGEGGALSTSGAQGLTFSDGAVLKVAGGTVDFAGSNSRPAFSSADSSVTGGIRLVSGAITNSPASSSGYLTMAAGATIEVEGGQLALRSYGWFADLARLTGDMRHVFDGDARLTYYNNASAALRVDGTLDFKGDSVVAFDGVNGGVCVFAPVTAGKTIDINFTERARLYAWDPTTSYRNTIVLGCPDVTMSAGETPVMRMMFDSDAEHRACGLWVGVERSGTAEVVLKRGSLKLDYYGLALGTHWETYWINASRNRGVFKMLGGELTTGGHGWGTTFQNRLCGIGVGNGVYEGLGDATHARYDNFRFSGRFELDGGVVTNTAGYVTVGMGHADGELIQRGGEMVLGSGSAARTPIAATGHPALYAVGGLTGCGLWAVSNGTVNAVSELQPMYVGGVSAYTLGEYCWRKAGGMDPGEFLTRYPAAPVASTGRLEVVSGSFTSLGDLFVGCDGRGEVDVVGSEGKVQFRNLVLSNNVESVVKFVFDANGVKPIALTGSATVTDGAKLVIDMSNFTGRRNGHPLITAAGGMTGRFENVTIVGDNEATRLAVLTQGAGGVRIAVQRGMSISFR